MAFPSSTTDVRSSPNEQIYHAVKVLQRSKHRQQVFEAIYRGKKKAKNVSDILDKTDLKSRVRVLQEGRSLADNHIVRQTKVNGETAYEKDPFYARNKRRILSLARNPRKLKKLPTKYNVNLAYTKAEKIIVPRPLVQARQVTIDDLDSFKRVRKLSKSTFKALPIRESIFKKGVLQIIGEKGVFKDWGGERNDLLSTRMRFNGRRIATAFAFKGQGQNGVLTPRLMGKNGDQIQRLFQSPAELFILQYWDQVGDAVVDQMKAFASLKSVLDGRKTYFCIVDGQDTQRLVVSYPHSFVK